MTILRSAALALALFLGACGNFPLFNHDTESGLRGGGSAGGAAGSVDPQCPVRFSPTLCATVEWPQPPHGKNNVFYLRFHDAAGAAVDPLRLMPGEGVMPSMPPPQMEPVDVTFAPALDGNGRPVRGSYIGSVYFTMKGVWALSIPVTDLDGSARVGSIPGVRVK